MKNLRRVSALAILTSVAKGAALVAVGCSGDDTTVPSDASTDSSISDGGGGDRSVPEGGVDAATPDAGETDAPNEDAANDAGSDAPDYYDASYDAAFDAEALYAFPSRLARAWCGQIAFCCGGQDASTFDFDRCVGFYLANGGLALGGIAFQNQVVKGGKVWLNTAAAEACIADTNPPGFTCDTFSGPYSAKINRDCAAAVQGLVPEDAGNADGGDAGSVACTNYFECAGSAYCENGVCVPLKANGDACGKYTTPYQCSKNGYGPPNLACQSQSADGGAPYLCRPLLPLGAACFYATDCASNYCDVPSGGTTKVCVSGRPGFSTTAACNFFARDAGP